MLDLDFDLLMLKDADHIVLRAYQIAEQVISVVPQTSAETADDPADRSRWIARIREVEGIPGDRLAPIHGRLIALGYLQFQLQGRDANVVYQVTPQGREVLSATAGKSIPPEPARRSA